MESYADSKFYTEDYLHRKDQIVPSEEFPYWAAQATSEVRERTFGNVDLLDNVPEDVQMCCCEVAEKLYRYEAAKGDNGLILQSYGNDGDTGSYKTDDYSQEAFAVAIDKIVRRWLVHTGLMYLGVDG